MNRYSFSGKGSILIKAGPAASYGGVQYEANEPIAYFTDVQVSLNFQYLEKTPKVAIDNLAVDTKSSPSYLQITNVKVSESLQSLLYKKQTNQTKSKTIVKSLTSTDGFMFLPILDGEEIIGRTFIYNNNKEKVDPSNYTINNITGEIAGLLDGRYTVFYSINKQAAATYALSAPTFPNMSVELHIAGNLNGKTGEAVVHLDKVKLLTRPTLDMTSENPFVDDLDFAILSGESEVNYYG